jgi:hypothetical protein
MFDAFSSVGVDVKGIMKRTGAELHYVGEYSAMTLTGQPCMKAP